MGMPVSVLARGSAARGQAAEDAARAVFAQLRAADAMFSTYRPDSAVSRLSAGELDLVACPAEVREVARRCAAARELTGGLFDADRPDGRWDPSGLVKGWAAERAAWRLAEAADVDWCLNCGGDVVVLSPSGAPFVVGIADPADRTRVAAAIPCVAGAVATSGTAARGAHLYDPRTAAPVAPRWCSVTVLGPSLETADVLATAAFVAGPAWRELIATVDGYAGMAIAADGKRQLTHTWPRSAAGGAGFGAPEIG